MLIGLVSCRDKDEEACPPASFSFSKEDLKLTLISKGIETQFPDSTNTVPLDYGGLKIRAEFNTEVSWEIEIINGSFTRKFSGTSNSIDQSWYGEFNKMIIGSGYTEIQLKINCRDHIMKSVNLTGTQEFQYLDKSYGIMLRDWDGRGDSPVAGLDYSNVDGWVGNGYGVDLYTTKYLSSNSSNAGGKYLQLYGKSTSPVDYFGGHTFPVSNIGSYLNGNDIDDIYINFYIRGDYYPNTNCRIGVQSSYVSYMYSKEVDWFGWKLVSIKLSELKSHLGSKLNSPDFEIVFIELSTSNNSKVTELQIEYDFVILTVGKPFLK